MERAAVDDPALVLAAAARLLESRARSVEEVRRRLTTAGYRADLVDGAIARLGDLGILDDEAFARAWVASRDRAHPRGERALRQELRLKGIGPAIIAAVLAERAGESARRDDDDPDHDHIRGRDDAEADEVREEGPMARGDSAAGDRLLLRSERSLLRIADPRRRRQRAWALLARAGFDSDTASEVTARAERRWLGGDVPGGSPDGSPD